MEFPVPLACNRLSKEFGRGATRCSAIQDVTLRFIPGECCALLGPSGSGKTTLLSILGCLMSPSSGDVTIDGQPVNYRQQGRLTDLRRTRIGYVFQQSQLLPFLSVCENLKLFGRNAGIMERQLAVCIDRRLEELGLQDRRHHRPDDLSGGERQRVAVARALLHSPAVLLADEPTGALDAAAGRRVMRLLVEYARRANAALLTVTHDDRVVDLFDRVLRIDSGRLEA